MGKKPARRGAGHNAESQKETPPSADERKAKRLFEWLRLGLLALVVAVLCSRLKTWYADVKNEAVAPESVVGPSDAVPALCSEELTASGAALLGVELSSLPSEAVARACLLPPRGRIVVVDGFLTATEVVHMKNLVLESIHKAEDHSQPGYQCVHCAGLQYPKGLLDEAETGGARTERYRSDAVFNEVERRIANFTGVPASMFEDLLQFSRDFHVAKADRRHANLHHDKNHGAPRHVTVLTYLTEVAAGSGGHTVFPALPIAEQLRPDWNSTFHNIFRNAFAGVKPGDAWPSVQVEDATPTAEALSVACDEVNRNSLAHFAVRPLPGRAVIFWHEDSHGRALPEQFHAGCPVLRGEKISLQKFKNFAPDHPQCRKSWYCSL